MNANESKPIMKNRREILRGGLRFGGFAAIGGVVSVLGWRNLRGDCTKTTPCGGCPLFSMCDLPKARETVKPATKPGHV